MNYYNEFDPKAAAWLRELIKHGLIPPGEVDERSITDVKASDLRLFTQCHFFAGIGGWSLALKLAGWPEDKPVWTGSCPCQPFSNAGKQRGEADERHLWPVFRDLIRQCRPSVVFGEQVASNLGREWFYAGVRPDLEGMGYAAGAADLCAAGAAEEGEGWVMRDGVAYVESLRIGAPNIRQRLFWVGISNNRVPDTNGTRWESGQSAAEAARHGDSLESDSAACGVSDMPGKRRNGSARTAGETGRPQLKTSGATDRMDDSLQSGLEGLAGNGYSRNESGRVGEEEAGSASETGGSCDCRMEHAGRERDEFRRRAGNLGCEAGEEQSEAQEREWRRDANSHSGPDGHWSCFDILPFRDGKARRVESGAFPLAHGVPGRVGLLRGYGNAIVPQVASEFIKAFVEIEGIIPEPGLTEP